MKIVHLNVRATEGGAAKIALMLHRFALEKNLESRFYYGYGPRGYASSISEEGVVMLSSPIRSRLNFLSSRTAGIDLFSGTSKAMAALEKDLETADVVHLHAIHSFFINYKSLFRMINNSLSIRKVVVTLHDFWFLTGRCAIKANCNLWELGCFKCPSMDAYPAALVDLAKGQAVAKRRLINTLNKDVVFISPSKHVQSDVKKAFPLSDARLIPNAIAVEFENSVNFQLANYNAKRSNKLKILVIAADLSDNHKVNQSLIEHLINLDFIEIHFVGKNCTYHGENVICHGELQSPAELVAVYASVDHVLFTSTVDTFGLVIVEALACGTPVLALQSSAADDILSRFGFTTYGSIERIKEAIIGRRLVVNETLDNRKLISASALEIYSARSMLSSYAKVYFDAR